MKVSIKTAQGYLSAQPVKAGRIARWQYRDVETPGPWEEFEIEGLVFPEPAPIPAPTPIPVPGPAPAPPMPLPPAVSWPPAVGMHPAAPPHIATVDVEANRARVRYWLWFHDSSDDESYWMKAIVLDPEPGHTPGWTADSYWADKIAAGDGVGKGYVWPAQ